MAYDTVLRLELPENCTAIGYADDTLVVVADSTVENAVARTDLALAMVCGEIKNLGLAVAPHKTKAMMFQRGRRKIPIGVAVAVKGVGANQPEY